MNRHTKGQRTIRQQVSQITAGVTALVVGVTLFIFVFISQQNIVNQAMEQARIAAQVIGSNLTASIVFDDPETAGELLAALAVSPEIVRARVYLDDGSLFVEYNVALDQSQFAELQEARQRVDTNSSYIKQIEEPIFLGATQVGSISVWLDSYRYQYQIYIALLLALVVWMMGTVIAYVMAQRLNARVTRPLNNLSDLMMRVSSQEDYSSRFLHNGNNGNNEIAVLGNSFNQMLGQIEDREQRLRHVIKALELARDEAQTATRSKTNFLANMSHEIRTPMNGVVGMISLLKRTELSEQQKLYFDTIDKSASSLLMIIDDILDFTKIEAGRLAVKSEVISLKENIASIEAFFADTARLKGIDFIVVQDAYLPARVIGDSGRLRQVLLNLLGNAMKFTEQGSVRLEVGVVGSVAAERIRFEITDTGIGVAAEEQPRVFSEFFQADSTSTRQFGGTGLGLAIGKQLVTLMGGSIGFQSALGIGSTFWFELPLKTEVVNPFFARPGSSDTKKLNPFSKFNPFTHDRASKLVRDGDIAETAKSVQKSASVKTTAFSGKVLVAEDSGVNQFIIRELLAAFGLIPTIVANGQEAVDSFQSNEYDLVLMDIQMPIMDGVTATRSLRHLQAHKGVNPNCLVVGLSAHAMSGDRERYLDAGMDDYLTKPIAIDELESVLENALASINDMTLWR